MRANPDDGIPNDLMVEYYSQRVSFGLIIAEGSPISPLSTAFPGERTFLHLTFKSFLMIFNGFLFRLWRDLQLGISLRMEESHRCCPC